MCYARILDAKRRFLEVAMRYYELSSLNQLDIKGQKYVYNLFIHYNLNSMK